MSTEVIMPQMGESIAEGTITKWFKKVGDKVERDEPLFEISTDKVDTEIPSPSSGVLSEIKVGEGETVSINTVVAVIGGEGETVVASQPAEPPPTLPGEIAYSDTPAPSASTPAQAMSETAEREGGVRSSPLVRRIAREHGIDLSQVPGTGRGGRITKDDILSFVEKGVPAAVTAPILSPEPEPVAPVGATGTEIPTEPIVPEPAAPAPSPPPAVPEPAAPPPVTVEPVIPEPVTPVPAAPEPAAPAPVAPTPLAPAPRVTTPPAEPVGTREERVPMSIMRKSIAEHMLASRRTSAHVSTLFEADVTRVVKLREHYKGQFLEQEGVKLTYTPFFIRAVIGGLKAFPIINTSIDQDAIVYKKDINIGIAVALEWGLIVPVIRNADEKSFLGLNRAVSDLADRARRKKLLPEEVQGGTFTLTNPGPYGGLFGLPIINQPQVAIMGLGGIHKRPVVVGDAIAIRDMVYLSLSFDHRLIDGAVADQFMAEVKKRLENWEEKII
jgi:2-oxoglutarate dehydrogenase E2 component (dihydrolipoamide succinyltransferase)